MGCRPLLLLHGLLQRRQRVAGNGRPTVACCVPGTGACGRAGASRLPDQLRLRRGDAAAFQEIVHLPVNFRKLEREHFFQAFQSHELLVEQAAAFAAQCPESAPDRLKAQRIAVGGHAGSLQQGHVAELYPPVIDLLVVSQVAGDFADADVELEVVIANQRDARRGQTAGLFESFLLLF